MKQSNSLPLSQFKCLKPREKHMWHWTSVVPKNVRNNNWKKIVSENIGKSVLIIA